MWSALWRSVFRAASVRKRPSPTGQKTWLRKFSSGVCMYQRDVAMNCLKSYLLILCAHRMSLFMKRRSAFQCLWLLRHKRLSSGSSPKMSRAMREKDDDVYKRFDTDARNIFHEAVFSVAPSTMVKNNLKVSYALHLLAYS